MDGCSKDHHSDLSHGRLVAFKKPQAVRNSEDVRRNRLNMEKMIMKNVAASRNSTKNRAQQIVEALKKKRQLEEETADETDRQVAFSLPGEGYTRAAMAVAHLCTEPRLTFM